MLPSDFVIQKARLLETEGDVPDAPTHEAMQLVLTELGPDKWSAQGWVYVRLHHPAIYAQSNPE